eukprot:6264523-Amphidinium_carterae.1
MFLSESHSKKSSELKKSTSTILSIHLSIPAAFGHLQKAEWEPSAVLREPSKNHTIPEALFTQARDVDEADDGKWKSRHADMLRKASVTDWTSDMFDRFDYTGFNTTRQQDLIRTVFLILEQEHGREQAKTYFVDVSQDIRRKKWSQSCTTITTSTSLFSYAVGRKVAPQELLQLLGFCNIKLENLSGNEIKSLAGEAMAMPSIALAVHSVVACLPLFEGKADE